MLSRMNIGIFLFDYIRRLGRVIAHSNMSIHILNSQTSWKKKKKLIYVVNNFTELTELSWDGKIIIYYYIGVNIIQRVFVRRMHEYQRQRKSNLRILYWWFWRTRERSWAKEWRQTQKSEKARKQINFQLPRNSRRMKPYQFYFSPLRLLMHIIVKYKLLLC